MNQFVRRNIYGYRHAIPEVRVVARIDAVIYCILEKCGIMAWKWTILINDKLNMTKSLAQFSELVNKNIPQLHTPGFVQMMSFEVGTHPQP